MLAIFFHGRWPILLAVYVVNESELTAGDTGIAFLTVGNSVHS